MRSRVLALPGTPAAGRLGAGAAIAAAVASAALLRLPFLQSGVGPDEGGYAYVADQWGRGARLYAADWVDRPQGLLVAYRLLLAAGHSAWAIRLGALLFGCGITLLLGIAAWLLAGPWAGAAAALLYAVVGVAPYLQGFTFNGELAAALPSTGAVTAALVWRKNGRARWLLIAGAAGAVGLLMKQSGFDGLLVALALALAGRSVPGRRARAAGLVAVGAAVPLAASAIHGALVGWSNYWFAVVGYKLFAPSGAGSDVRSRLGSFSISWLGAQRDLALPVIAALILTALAVLRRQEIWIPSLWFLAAFVGFNAASLYWAHYYVQLLAPLVLLITVAAFSLPSRALAVAAIASVLVTSLVKLVAFEGMSRAASERVIPYYGQFLRDERVANQVDLHSRPGQAIYALDSEADLYFLADRPAAFRYLWGHPLLEIPGALGHLRGLLAGPERPELVVEFRSPQRVDPSGGLSRILARGYRPLETVPGTGIPILQAVAIGDRSAAGNSSRSSVDRRTGAGPPRGYVPAADRDRVPVSVSRSGKRSR